MSKIVLAGPFRYIARSYASIMATSLRVLARRMFRGPLAPGWRLDFEIGNEFWREQFTRAFAMPDIREGRIYFDSLQTGTDEVYEVERSPAPPGAPKGAWIIPRRKLTDATILYLHGGGYAFHAAITHRFADMLAYHLGARVFALDYPLTPEHPHPAQKTAALEACRYLFESGVDPRRWVVMGDSAGGHMALMSLISLKEAGLPQPALAIGLCPWTDVGERGASLTTNNKYDLVQGWMALRFGEWLIGNSGATREELSPINQDYRGLAPLYLQGGGREMLIDMIRDFAHVVAEQGCEVTLDVWPQMTHEFQAHGFTHPDSSEAIERLRAAIAHYTDGADGFEAGARTEVHAAGA